MSQMPPLPPPPGPMYPPSQEAPGATTGLVLGIISIIVTVPLVGLILAFIGLQKSRQARALCQMHPGYYSNAGVAQAGFVLSIIGLCLGGLSSLCCCGYFAVVVLGLAASAAGAGSGGGGFGP